MLYLVISAGLLALARWGESEHDIYPWKHEDYLRYLVGDLFEYQEGERIFLAGPSETREGLVREEFERAFPETRAFQGGQSLGTFDDLLLALEYLSKAHGADAMPQTLVLGITPRFVANIPRDSSPLVLAINRYSPHYRVEQTPVGSSLAPKSWWEAQISRIRFLSKQQPRYFVALGNLYCWVVGDDLLYRQFEREIPRMRALRTAIQRQAVDQIAPAIDYAREVGLATYVARWLRLYMSPYKYHHLSPLPPDVLREWLDSPDSFWYKGHLWDPASDAELIQRQFARLLEFTEEWEIDLYVVNLPEHAWNRERYRPGRYEEYLRLVRSALGSTPFLNLREMLPSDAFYDVGHPTLTGALQVTERIIEFMKDAHWRASR